MKFLCTKYYQTSSARGTNTVQEEIARNGRFVSTIGSYHRYRWALDGQDGSLSGIVADVWCKVTPASMCVCACVRLCTANIARKACARNARE